MHDRRTFFRTSGLVLSTAALGLGATACSRTSSGGGAAGDGDLLERLRKAGKITVAFAGEAPYSFEDGGELTGATIALHREIFPALGIDEVEGVLTEWGSLIPGLNAKRFDAVSAGMSILPDRCSEVAFTDPEIQYTTAILTPKGNPEGLENLQSFEGKDLKLATMSGAIESDYCEQLGIDNMQVQSPQDGVDAVQGGRADAFALTGISLKYMVEKQGIDLDVTDPFVAEVDGVKQFGAGSTVLRPDEDSASLLEAYNEELGKIMGDTERFLGIVGDFGFTEAEIPPEEMTTEMLCKGDLSELQ